ncbi:MAG: helix-turn-helix domain-containing protein [Candidatus Acidiferrales bacterium]
MLTVKEVAAYLGFHPETVRQMARDGRLPHLKVGNRLRFRPDQIEVWLCQREVAA